MCSNIGTHKKSILDLEQMEILLFIFGCPKTLALYGKYVLFC